MARRQEARAAGGCREDHGVGAHVRRDSLSRRLVKGSHILVPRLYEHDHSYIFQNADGRVCFAIPYEGDFTLIGTTDEDYRGDPAVVACTSDEEHYLCDAVSSYLCQPVKHETIVWRYAGVRPLLDDGTSEAQEATRDYVLELSDDAVLSVIGGKITTSCGGSLKLRCVSWQASSLACPDRGRRARHCREVIFRGTGSII